MRIRFLPGRTCMIEVSRCAWFAQQLARLDPECPARSANSMHRRKIGFFTSAHVLVSFGMCCMRGEVCFTSSCCAGRLQVVPTRQRHETDQHPPSAKNARERLRTNASIDPSIMRVLTKQRLKHAGAGEGNRTLVVSLGSCCSTIELHPRGHLFTHHERPPQEQSAKAFGGSMNRNTVFSDAFGRDRAGFGFYDQDRGGPCGRDLSFWPT